MDDFKAALSKAVNKNVPLPISVITSIADQYILNVPILKPLLICVLGGSKELGSNQVRCQHGDFIFLSNTPTIDMRNISQQGSPYFALLIEFEYSDFDVFETRPGKSIGFFTGKISDLLQITIRQFVELAPNLPEELWALRRREILQLIWHMGYKEVCSIVEPPSLAHKVEGIISNDLQQDLSGEEVAGRLAMSDSSMRRKLSAEDTNFQTIKDRIKLGHGLYMLQTSDTPIGLVAQACGYQSQSRFTDKFKVMYGLTPSELRKTRFKD